MPLQPFFFIVGILASLWVIAYSTVMIIKDNREAKDDGRS